METYSPEVPEVQAPRRQSIRQIASHALRQTKRLGDGDMVLTWVASEAIGKTLAAVMMRRRAEADQARGEIDFAQLIEYLLDVPAASPTPDHRARRALCAELCTELEKVMRWAYERKMIDLPHDERAAMTCAVKQADGQVRRWRSWRESFVVQ